jgi:MFS family permease
MLFSRYGVFISMLLMFIPLHSFCRVMPIMQLGLLIFFILNAYFQWWYDWSLLSLCVVVGFFGGAVYVHGYSLLAESVPPELKEFSLSAAGIAVDFGVAFADVAGILIQQALYKYHDISD